MLVLGTLVDVEVGEQVGGQFVFGKHALDDAANELLVAVGLGDDVSGSAGLLTAGVHAVAEIDAVGHLLAGEQNLVGIDDDDIVAAIHVGSEAGLVLATQELSHFGGETAEDLVGGVYDNPLFLGGHLVGRNGFVT